ncbi:hypothetical protein C8J56DRAFT_818164 [Mycena floridula]|nr:hypothetical protein C8J56DRAFT_818164 [Mycena floridula]
MVSKKTKQAKRAAATTSTPSGSTANGTTSSDPSSSKEEREDKQPSPSTSSSPEPEPVEEDASVRAEKTKEEGNVAFKAGRYQEAIDLYTSAIELNKSEASYLTNRAASYIALKRFRPALDDCQKAATIQSAVSPTRTAPPKTLLRLARCQLALGLPTPALSTISNIPGADPAASALKIKVMDLEGHLRTLEKARKARDYSLMRLALDKCYQAIEGDGPLEWRLWRVELMLAQSKWEDANNAASDALRLFSSSPEVLTSRALVLFLSGKLTQAVSHLVSALRLDPQFELASKLRKRVKDVERLKDEGNTFFKGGQLEQACEKYGEALDRIGTEDHEGKGGIIRAILLSNRATTLVKMNKFDEALVDTDESLLLSPNQYKALRTRARIHLHLESYDKCVVDFKSAIEAAMGDGMTSDTEIKNLKAELKKAEIALKRSKTKDYYKILGLKRDCTEAEIKKAYRRESLIHHPDKGGDEEKFKLVVEANNVLSDPDRRERYDMGDDEDGERDGGGAGFGGMGGMSQADIAQLFAQFGGGGAGGFGGGFGGHGGFGGGSRSRGHAHGGGFSF